MIYMVCNIVCNILETRINHLIENRDEAIQNEDYDRAWKLNMRIDKNINRLVTNSY